MSEKKENSPFLHHKLYTFIIDPIFLVGSGILIAYLAVKFLYKRFPESKRFILLILCGATLCIFWLISGAFYFDFDLISVFFLGEHGNGNYFMWNSGFELLGLGPIIDTTIPTYTDWKSPINILAIGIFLLIYPPLLYLGVAVGFRLFNKLGPKRPVKKK